MMNQSNKYPEPDRSKFKPNQYKDDPTVPEGDIGFTTGILLDGRPYRLESWYSEGYTLITLFFSIIDIENADPKQILDLLSPILVESVQEEYRKLREDGIHIIADDAGNKMYSITFVVGEAD